MTDKKRSVIEHLEELRSRIIVILIFFGILSVIGFLISSDIIEFIETDILPETKVELIATRPTDFMLMKINIAIFFGVVFSSPVIVYQFLSFIKPVLTRNERRYLIGGVLAGVLLFMTGLLFGYNVLVRFAIWFLAGLSSNAGILNMWNINEFVSFMLFSCITVGILFELPLITYILAKMDIIDHEFLKEQRRYFIIAIFILAAILTPPDPFTQIIIALPMLLLYEISIIIVRFTNR